AVLPHLLVLRDADPGRHDPRRDRHPGQPEHHRRRAGPLGPPPGKGRSTMSKQLDAKAPWTPAPETRARIDEALRRYPTKASAIMPCIWAVQDELGWVPPAGIDLLVAELGVTRARVHEVLSFYTMFRTEPQADHVLQVCHNISCHVMG